MNPEESPPVPHGDEAALAELGQAVFLPAILAANWWQEMFYLWSPAPRQAQSGQDCHELIVPEPLEAEDERALFA